MSQVKQIERLMKDVDNERMLRYALEAENSRLNDKIKLYESALLRAFPNGAGDGVFELWNEARKLK